MQPQVIEEDDAQGAVTKQMAIAANTADFVTNRTERRWRAVSSMRQAREILRAPALAAAGELALVSKPTPVAANTLDRVTTLPRHARQAARLAPFR